MKYEIKGIEKGKTIKSVQVIDGIKAIDSDSSKTNGLLFGESHGRNMRQEAMLKAKPTKIIIVDYLDGTQDVYEFDEEIINRIQNVVDAQAELFVKKENKKFPLSL